jgi:hypothetical protein
MIHDRAGRETSGPVVATQREGVPLPESIASRFNAKVLQSISAKIQMRIEDSTGDEARRSKYVRLLAEHHIQKELRNG